MTQIQSNDTERAKLRKVFISLVAADLVGLYVDRILDYCASHKLGTMQKRSREVRALRAKYDDYLARVFDPRHKTLVRSACKDFAETFSYDLTVMSCTLANAMYKQHVGKAIDHDSMRADALCCCVLLRALFTMRDMAYLPTLKELERLVSGYAEPYAVDLTENVEACRKIMAKRLAGVPEMEYKGGDL